MNGKTWKCYLYIWRYSKLIKLISYKKNNEKLRTVFFARHSCFCFASV
jgi:hypothetical protein